MIGKIKVFLDSIETRNEFRERALEWAATFDWEIAADRTLELMENSIRKYALFRSRSERV
jgi:hypothetical protein